jgi:integrase/recombinase XerD
MRRVSAIRRTVGGERGVEMARTPRLQQPSGQPVTRHPLQGERARSSPGLGGESPDADAALAASFTIPDPRRKSVPPGSRRRPRRDKLAPPVFPLVVVTHTVSPSATDEEFQTAIIKDYHGALVYAGYAPGTIANYLAAITFMLLATNLPIWGWNKEALRGVRMAGLLKGYAARTLTTYYRALRIFEAFLFDPQNGWLEAAEKRKTPLQRFIPPGPLGSDDEGDASATSDHDMQAIFDYLRHRVDTDVKWWVALRDYTMAVVKYAVGARACEVIAMHRHAWSGVPDAPQFGDYAAARLVGKGGKPRTSRHITPELPAVMELYEREARPHFSGAQTSSLMFLSERGEQLGRDHMGNLIRRARRAVGADERVTGHKLRHASITNQQRAGVPPAAVMLSVGHSSMAMLARYTQMEPAEMNAGYQRALAAMDREESADE